MADLNEAADSEFYIARERLLQRVGAVYERYTGCRFWCVLKEGSVQVPVEEWNW